MSSTHLLLLERLDSRSKKLHNRNVVLCLPILRTEAIRTRRLSAGIPRQVQCAWHVQALWNTGSRSGIVCTHTHKTDFSAEKFTIFLGRCNRLQAKLLRTLLRLCSEFHCPIPLRCFISPPNSTC